MSPERWQQVKSIVAEAIEADPLERSRLIADRCGEDAELRREVGSLLPYAGETTATIGDLSGPGQPIVSGEALIGQSIGPYKVEKLLGEGGMGSVYLAYREVEGYAMPVAIKIIRLGTLSDYARHRFRRERQILARLSHPNITRLLDGGVNAEGLPYLVTEYVEGVPLDEYVTTAQPPLRNRLALFLDLCSALAFAHRNLVVHGDIKPNNVLVTADGVPKLLDFGIARLLDPDSSSITQTASIALTPAWASPEQLKGDPASIPADLYSLGRVFYELIAGRPAFVLTGRTPRQIAEIICGQIPLPSAGSGSRELTGDLDNIAVKGIDPEAAGRYSSADQFADDIRRHLESRPILARKPTLFYRAGKFARRNRAGFVAAVAISVALTVGLGLTLWQARIAHSNAQLAIRHAEGVRKLANSFIFELDDTVAEFPGATKTRAAIMKAAVDYLDRLAAESAGDRGLRQELAVAYMKIADIQGRPGSANLGNTAAALESYGRARQLWEMLAREFADDKNLRINLANIYLRISAVQRLKGSFQDALEYDRKALEIRKALFEKEPDNPGNLRGLAQTYNDLAVSLWQIGDTVGTMEGRRQAVEIYQKLVAANPKSITDRRGLALSRARLGGALLESGDNKPAIRELTEALALEKQLIEEQPANAQIRLSYATASRSLGRAYAQTGDSAKALTYLEQARSNIEVIASADADDVRVLSLLAGTRVSIGRTLIQFRRAKEALVHLQWALETRRKLAEASPLNAGARGEVAEAHAVLGDIHLALKAPDAARASYLEARRILQQMTRSGLANANSTAELRRVEQAISALGSK